ncbi:hypothetical protein BDF14DRAFT_51393 [Spinellus fusiger]|nr:hypothetical protein BDF14DRAFT_51393 [Spinellus fusiger]
MLPLLVLVILCCVLVPKCLQFIMCCSESTFESTFEYSLLFQHTLQLLCLLSRYLFLFLFLCLFLCLFLFLCLCLCLSAVIFCGLWAGRNSCGGLFWLGFFCCTRKPHCPQCV